MAPIEGDGWRIEDHTDEQRLWIVFDRKPERAMLEELRRAGFKWSPTRGAHVRMTSNGALWAAKRALGVP